MMSLTACSMALSYEPTLPPLPSLVAAVPDWDPSHDSIIELPLSAYTNSYGEREAKTVSQGFFMISKMVTLLMLC